MVLYAGFFIFTVILISSPLKGLSKRGGYLNFQFLCYKNPGHLDYYGNNCDSFSIKCDPYFSICISNKLISDASMTSCSVYHTKTEPYFDTESVCDSPKDNRGTLRIIPPIELPYPTQEHYYIRIDVNDANSYTVHQPIATFEAVFSEKPTENNGKYINIEKQMYRTDFKFRNPRASLKISVGLKCDWDLYGAFCETFCKALPTDHYRCSRNGHKICNKGWEGENCQNRDLCHNLRCSKGSRCIKIDNIAKCFCNGTISPRCYGDFDPCQPNPCQNGGKCVGTSSMDDTPTCNCTPLYHGSKCELNLCQIDPCRNNGTCVISSSLERFCKCPPDFYGKLCEYSVEKVNITTNETIPITGYSRNIMNYGLVFGVLFGLCLFIIFIIGIYSVLMSNPKTYEIHNSVPLKPLPQQPPEDSTTYSTFKDETQYDTIEDRATYVYHLNNNDDYLVPSKPLTPTKSPISVSGSSDYIPMCNNDNLYTGDDVTVEILPPLPTRNNSKTKFKLFGSLKR